MGYTPLFESIRGVQRPFCWFYKQIKWAFLLSNQRKECRRPKLSCISVLVEGEVEGNIDDWFSISQIIYFALDT